MKIKQIPLSTSEAWRLYNQGQDVRAVSNYRFYGKPLPKDLVYEDFTAKKRLWVLQLSEEDSELIDKKCKKRGRKMVGGLYLTATGLALFMLYLSNTPSPKFSPNELLIYGNALIFLGCYLFVSLFESFKAEEQAWALMYKKFKISDWQNS
jgi:hypothetical protein